MSYAINILKFIKVESFFLKKYKILNKLSYLLLYGIKI